MARLSLVLATLAAAASLAGLLAPELYRDEPLVRDGWRVNDAVTLLVALPVLLVARLRALRGSARARLVWLGALHYALYNYAFYLFGAVLNPLLLLYAAIVGLAIWSLGLGLAELDVARLAATFERPPQRRVAAWMLFVALGLTVTWTAQWLVALLRTTPAARFDLTPDFVRLVAALDLTLMVGLLVPGALLLVRGRPWGLALGVALNVSGALYNLVLAGGSVVQLRAGLAGAAAMIALWVGLGIGCFVAASALLASAGRRSAAPPSPRGGAAPAP